jgi:hypothetical protein
MQKTLLFSLALATACREGSTPDDSGPATDGGPSADRGPTDGGTPNTGPVDVGMEDGGSDLGLDAGPGWEDEHCRNRTCIWIRQGEPGASDVICNGRAPVDRGTTDQDGRRNCPLASFQSAYLQALMAPNTGPNRSKTFFVGGGTYRTYPFGISLVGDGQNADEGLRLSNLRGEKVVLSGQNCPASCEYQGPNGPVTVTPCCAIKCDSCSSDPRCVDLGDDCGVPWDTAYRPVTIAGRWTRIEGMEIEGCISDAVTVATVATLDGQSLVPNDHLYLSNNRIHGCQINENIKGLRQGPGPTQGGPYWGPTEIIGNELLEMGSQAIDATGVQNWRVEENHLHSPKPVDACLGTPCDGGGIGFKNGGALARVRNNWLRANNGITMGGVAGSCLEDTSPPNGFGCFQRYEHQDGRVENNVIADAPRHGLMAYQCDDCGYLGNYLSNFRGAGFFLQDDCPGPRCPSHNPGLLPSRDLVLAHNHFGAGALSTEGPYFLAYFRDVFPSGPAANGMNALANTFCAPQGLLETATPELDVARFAHAEPQGLYNLPDYAAQVGDQGSRVYNDGAAQLAACPAPPRCTLSVTADAGIVRWEGAADGVQCTLAIDEVESTVPCQGERATTPGERGPGRHYLSLRAELGPGQPAGASCGLSYQLGAPFSGSRCTLGLVGDTLQYDADGLRCLIVADDGQDLGVRGCRGTLTLPPGLRSGARHHLRFQVLEAPDGQTTCGLMFTPGSQ